MSAIYETLKSVRAKYPASVTKDQCVAILNETAWVHRGEGIGLLRKDGPTCAPQPGTGIVCDSDILMKTDPEPGWYSDVLGASGAGIATPQEPDWQPAGDIDAEFVAPVVPDGVTPGPDPEPTPGPSDFGAAATSLEQQVNYLTARVASLSARVEQLETVTPSLDGLAIGLQDSSGKFVCAEQGEAEHPLKANRETLGSWETFIIRY